MRLVSILTICLAYREHLCARVLSESKGSSGKSDEEQWHERDASETNPFVSVVRHGNWQSSKRVGTGNSLSALRMLLLASDATAALQPNGAIGSGLKSTPIHLVVLQNGLYGSAKNLEVLEQKLTDIAGSGVLVHRATSNQEAITRDGVAAGGRRLAEEVRAVAAKHPSLRKLSLVGNSLGGLYVRYAATELFDTTSGEMAGLKPEVLLTTGCPHLGVRRGIYVPLPPEIHPLGRFFAGQSADDLLLRDDLESDRSEPLLVTMSRPDSPHGVALQAFKRRRLYANLFGDFMVPFGTAAIENDRWGAGISDFFLGPSFLKRPWASFRDPEVCAGERDGIAVIRDDAPLDIDLWSGAPATYEELMRRGLSAVAWSRVATAFHGTIFLPFAHNKLAALRRPGWRSSLDAIEQTDEGESVMEHAALYIVEGDPADTPAISSRAASGDDKIDAGIVATAENAATQGSSSGDSTDAPANSASGASGDTEIDDSISATIENVPQGSSSGVPAQLQAGGAGESRRDREPSGNDEPDILGSMSASEQVDDVLKLDADGDDVISSAELQAAVDRTNAVHNQADMLAAVLPAESVMDSEDTFTEQNEDLKAQASSKKPED